MPSNLAPAIRSRSGVRWLCLLLAGALLSSLTHAQVNPAATPLPPPVKPKCNVLLLLADDLNCDLGCYGVTEVRTPNLDRLAARGVRFDSAYCQFPYCCPSRSSFLTGRRPNVTGVLRNPTMRRPISTHFREKLPETITLPQLFKRNGAFSARVGKVFHYAVPADIGSAGFDDYLSWDLAINPRGRDRDDESKITTLIPGEYAVVLSWLADREGADTDHTDAIGATEAVRLLERFKREGRQFFLGVGFYRPHLPFVAPKRFFDLYQAESVSLPNLSADDRARPVPLAWMSARPEQDQMSDDLRRQAILAYHAATSFMDEQVGRVIEALDRMGLGKDTVIVFASDNGFHLADHGLWQKQSLFERSARVPLIIATPDAKSKGGVARAPVELLDLYPTLAGLAGLPAPDYLDGVSLQPVLDNPAAVVKRAAFTQLRRGNNSDGYSVRSGRWRYTEWLSPTGELVATQLFDEEADPAESSNLAANPAHASTVAELAALLAPIKAQR